MNDWFRSWHGAPTDNKWLVIARKAKVTPGFVSAVVWALLDYASQIEPRGSIVGFDVETYAAFSGWEEETIEGVIAALKDKGVINPDGGFHNWGKRQPKRDDGSAERAKAWRERRRPKPNAPERKRPQANASERQIRGDTDTDADTEKRDSEESISIINEAADAASLERSGELGDDALDQGSPKPEPVAKPKPSGPLWPEDAFAQFWQTYPRKVGRAVAEKAFARIATSKHRPEFVVVMTGLGRMIAAKVEERFIPHPTTWLNGGRWDDESFNTPAHYGQSAIGNRPARPPTGMQLFANALLDDLRNQHHAHDDTDDQPGAQLLIGSRHS